MMIFQNFREQSPDAFIEINSELLEIKLNDLQKISWAEKDRMLSVKGIVEESSSRLRYKDVIIGNMLSLSNENILHILTMFLQLTQPPRKNISMILNAYLHDKSLEEFVSKLLDELCQDHYMILDYLVCEKMNKGER